MGIKERQLWKQESEEKIRDFVQQAFNREAENLCPVDRLKAISDQVRRSSCGECVICREGTLQMYVMSESISQGAGRDGDLEVLAEISKDMAIGSACDYGKEIGKRATDIVENEVEQFEKHIKRKRCDALVCKKLFRYYIMPEKCNGCNKCVTSCNLSAIAGSQGFIHVINPAECNRCGACVEVCETLAIQKSGGIVPGLATEPILVSSYQQGTENSGLMSKKRRRRSE